jgi:hypothetical protein
MLPCVHAMHAAMRAGMCAAMCGGIDDLNYALHTVTAKKSFKQQAT